MKKIPLTQNQYALVDDDDYESLSKLKWQAQKDEHTFYATRTENKIAYKMHRVIFGLSKEDIRVVDHIDGNGLNNQKYNLRVCTRAQNLQNKRAIKKSTSGYKGVYKSGNKWVVVVYKEKKHINLGTFVNKEEAAKVYNRAILEIRGEFAVLNKIVER